MIDRLLRGLRARTDADKPTTTAAPQAAQQGSTGDDYKVRQVIDQLLAQYDMRERELRTQKRDLAILRANVMAIKGNGTPRPPATPASMPTDGGDVQAHDC